MKVEFDYNELQMIKSAITTQFTELNCMRLMGVISVDTYLEEIQDLELFNAKINRLLYENVIM
jgi:hypothetical protein